MENVLFLQSEVKDPYQFYARMRHEHPVYYDEANKIWAVFKYSYCQEILLASQSWIPALKSKAYENNELSVILEHLARLSNGTNHEEARNAAKYLVAQMKTCDLPSMLHHLIGEPRLPATFEWVSTIAKRLPALALLNGFGYPVSEALTILPEIENLNKLMSTVNTEEELKAMVVSVQKIREGFYAHVIDKVNRKNNTDMYLANFIGLLIQSYDATRGLLSNSLLHFINHVDQRPTSLESFVKFVKESARVDPAVQNTRRVLTSQIKVGRYVMNAGAHVLIVLASANRDAEQFTDADNFVYDRTTEALSFGTGMHKCIAEHFSTHLAASLLHNISKKYSQFEIQETEIHYESRINLRLPKRIILMTS